MTEQPPLRDAIARELQALNLYSHDIGGPVYIADALMPLIEAELAAVTAERDEWEGAADQHWENLQDAEQALAAAQAERDDATDRAAQYQDRMVAAERALTLAREGYRLLCAEQDALLEKLAAARRDAWDEGARHMGMAPSACAAYNPYRNAQRADAAEPDTAREEVT